MLNIVIVPERTFFPVIMTKMVAQKARCKGGLHTLAATGSIITVKNIL